MKSIHPPLPAAILSRAHIESARAMMAQAEDHLSELRRQLGAFKLAGVFELNPLLSGFSFELERGYDDDGRHFVRPQHQARLSGGQIDEESLDDLHEDVRIFLERQSPEWLEAREGFLFQRPSEGEDPVCSAMRQYLDASGFALWQARALDLCAELGAPAPAAPSL